MATKNCESEVNPETLSDTKCIHITMNLLYNYYIYIYTSADLTTQSNNSYFKRFFTSLLHQPHDILAGLLRAPPTFNQLDDVKTWTELHNFLTISSGYSNRIILCDNTVLWP